MNLNKPLVTKHAVYTIIAVLFVGSNIWAYFAESKNKDYINNPGNGCVPTATPKKELEQKFGRFRRHYYVCQDGKTRYVVRAERPAF